MGVKLSHTAKEKYLNCPLSYHMHYNLGYRENLVGSALPFGSAIDEALNFLLLNKNKVNEAKSVYEKELTKQLTSYKDAGQDIRFSKADFDDSLGTTVEESLLTKGLMILDQYNEQVISKIKKVVEVQKYFSIPNGVGDEIIGFIDMVVQWEDDRFLLLDNKTASQKYNDEFQKIDTDKLKQVATYREALKDKMPIDGQGFIVIGKNIRKKKEPRVVIQEIFGNVTEDLVDQTFQEYDDVLYNIRMGNFPSNHPNCNSYFGPCICDKYAPSGGEDTSGLIQLKKKVTYE